MGLSHDRQEEQVSVISSLVAFMEPFKDFKVKMWKICLSVCLKMMWLHTYVLRGESARVDQFIMLIKARTKINWGFFFFLIYLIHVMDLNLK